MNRYFRYVGESEKERDAYLEKAAKWMYSIKENEETEDGIKLEEILSDEDLKELENYIFTIMYPVIEQVGRNVAKKFDIYDELSVVDRIAMEVIKDFYKYNNEVFLKDGNKYPFYVFVLGHARGAIRDENMAELCLTRRVYDKYRGIEKIRKTISGKYGRDEDSINPAVIAKWYKNFYKEEITADEVSSILNFVYPKGELYQIDQEYAYEDEIDVLGGDVAVEKALIKAYECLRPIEQFILLQQYGFCSDRYKDLSVRQLSCDSDFVRMAFLDKVAMCNLEYGTLKMKRPRIDGFETRDEALIVPATFYVKNRFINNTRQKCKDIIARELLEANLSYNQCVNNIDDICMQLWEKLEDDYLIRKE